MYFCMNYPSKSVFVHHLFGLVSKKNRYLKNLICDFLFYTEFIKVISEHLDILWISVCVCFMLFLGKIMNASALSHTCSIFELQNKQLN